MFNCASDLLSCTCEASPCWSFEPRTVKLLFKRLPLSLRILVWKLKTHLEVSSVVLTKLYLDGPPAVRSEEKQNLRWNNNLGEPRYSGSQESQTNSDNLNLLKTRLPSMTDRYQSHHTETKLHSIATSFTLVNATFLESEENMRRIDKKKAIMKQTSSVVKLKLFSDGQPVARIQWWTAFRPTESLIKVYLSICLLWWTGFSQILWIPVLPNCFVQDLATRKL